MIKEYEGLLYVRDEKNGITVYEKQTNLYKFYEGITLDKLRLFKNADEVSSYLLMYGTSINRNIVFGSPFHVNWLIEETCNLDCIYCFAHDKMHYNRAKEQIKNTAECIIKLGILNVGISGGEPLLNPYITDVIEILSGKCSINIDTNGTISSLGEMVKLLKEARVLVRITLDAVEENIVAKLRPAKNEFEQLPIIFDNIKTMLNAGVLFMVHTVVTRYNVAHLVEIAKKLAKLGVKRWHMYGVNYSEKCKEIYDEIRLSKNELIVAYMNVKYLYGNVIEMSLYFDEESYSANSVLLIDSFGRFYLDSIRTGIHYICENPQAPSLNDIQEELDIQLHCKGYLWTQDCI